MVTAFSAKTTLNGKTVPDTTGDHPTRIWGILIIVGVVVLVAGAVLTLSKKTKRMAWVQTAGAVLILGFSIGEIVYLNGKLSDAKKMLTDGSMPDGAKYSIGLQYGSWVALGVAVLAIAFSVLTALSVTDGSGAASASPYGSNALQALFSKCDLRQSTFRTLARRLGAANDAYSVGLQFDGSPGAQDNAFRSRTEQECEIPALDANPVAGL